ncbi:MULTISPECIES: hypothetical protein [Lysobacter]|uniref:hypothetical protein n=1 Tax=Lysobacter TaxID=68 RepID=UPI001F45B7EC|nr:MULTISPECIES: hypothetical protein [Lysobacter]UJB21432.1 hypothetical protein L1A79_10440 [Lysobacter capsici]UJQ29451.1 hypothetical protein L2D09_04425 [Lysobacter gummosus]
MASLFTYNANRTAAEEVVALVAEAGSEAVALPLDVGDASTFDAFVDRLRESSLIVAEGDLVAIHGRIRGWSEVPQVTPGRLTRRRFPDK